jgi:hypothetical protein
MKDPGSTDSNFEQEWREALDQASVTPPATVWNNVDRGLAYAEISVYKSKQLYYKWAVAAVVLIAVSLSAFQYLYFQDLLSDQTARVIDVNAPDDLVSEKLNLIIPNRSNTKLNIGKSNAVNLQSKSEEKNTAALTIGEVSNIFELLLVDNLAIESSNIQANLNGPELRSIPVYTSNLLMKKKDESERYWAGVDMGSASFNPNFQSDGNSLLSNSLSANSGAFSLADNEVIDTQSPSVLEGMTAGETVSLGVNFGIHLAKRWSLESGVQYARSGATTQTNVVIQSSRIQEVLPATSQAKALNQFSSVVASESVIEYDYRDVNLRNEFQFTSIPVTAGYKLIEGKLQVELNAGLITNFYMGNRLTSDDSKIAEVTIGPGDQSPYRGVSFSGLAGLQVGYRVMKRFDLLIQPNYRQGINDLTKDGTNFSTTPSGFGLLTGLRYNFN